MNFQPEPKPPSVPIWIMAVLTGITIATVFFDATSSVVTWSLLIYCALFAGLRILWWLIQAAPSHIGLMLVAAKDGFQEGRAAELDRIERSRQARQAPEPIIDEEPRPLF